MQMIYMFFSSAKRPAGDASRVSLRTHVCHVIRKDPVRMPVPLDRRNRYWRADIEPPIADVRRRRP